MEGSITGLGRQRTLCLNDPGDAGRAGTAA
jgi:hypothetical protein